MIPQRSQELIDRQLRRPQDRAQSAAIERCVVGHRDRRSSRARQSNVATTLTDFAIPEAHQRFDTVASRDDGQRRHYSTLVDCAVASRPHYPASTRTSTSSYCTGGVQPSSAWVSKQSWMASSILLNASARVRPWLIQPGITGHSATIQPSSPGTRTTGKRRVAISVEPSPCASSAPGARRSQPCGPRDRLWPHSLPRRKPLQHLFSVLDESCALLLLASSRPICQ